jgi:type IV pilus assembly protein PilQ
MLVVGCVGVGSLAVVRQAHAREALRHATDLQLVRGAEDGAAEVRVTFTAPPAYTARSTHAGRRLLVDVPNADVVGAPPTITEPVGVVGGVMAQTFATGRTKTTRILVTLLEDAAHEVEVEGRTLVIRLGRERKRAPPPTSGSRLPAADSAEGVRILDVRFDHKSYADRVYVDFSHVPVFKEKRDEDRAQLILEGARVPEALERTLDVSAFGGGILRVSTYEAPRKGSGRVIIEVEGRGGLESRVARNGNTLVWTFFEPGALPSSVTGIGSDGGIARKARTLHVAGGGDDIPAIATTLRSAGAVEHVTAPEDAAAFTPTALAQAAAPGRYTGRRIDLDLKDADIHNVLRLLADVGRVNIVTADDVSGSVTIRMRNIPWDQALDVILQSKRLGMTQRGTIIRVAPIEQLEKEREMAIARRNQEMQLAPLETRLIPVSYAQATEIQARARDLLSPRGSIAVDARTNVMIVRDIAGNLDQIEELTRSLDTQTPQVLVEARIVEATSRYIRDIGIQWGGDATFSAATGNPTGLAFPNSVGMTGGASDTNTPTQGLSPFQATVPNPNFAVNLPAAVGTGSGGALGLTFGSVDNNFNLNLRLSAAESSGMLRILSSPRILTLDNREARISQGTLIPFSQVSAQGVQTVFQEAKLQLLVQPHVTADGSISMHVKINRDEPDFNQTSARGDPTILKREAETELLVMDGHTAVIGGIYTRNTGRNVDQVPFFGDIPILGLLFQKRRASDTRGELVIFLTPRIVNRAEALGR